MFLSLPGLVLVSQLAIPVADRVPALNVDPTCDAAQSAGVMLKRDKQTCLNEEHDARDTLAKQWSQYPSADRTRCAESTKMGGVPSYVELLTCLEMAKSARELPKDDLNDPTVGSGASND
jgi:hypothetical protein